jgi:hypothetical protein
MLEAQKGQDELENAPRSHGGTTDFSAAPTKADAFAFGLHYET